MKRATTKEIKLLVKEIRKAMKVTFAERHNNLAQAREVIAEAVLRIRQLEGILEVRAKYGSES
jgi:hypothetical protein